LVFLDCMMPEMDGFTLARRIQSNPELNNPTMVMISSAGQLENKRECKRAGIFRYLNKPVIHSELLDCIVAAFSDESLNQALLESSIEKTAQATPLSILLVEDSIINQRVALGLLQRHGHKISVADNGKDAVEAATAGAFDLVLMDVHMPDMDGLLATKEIRKIEARIGKRTPIIAMTADAMKGDKERCLDAGMDDYVSKPIQAEELYRVIQRTSIDRPQLTNANSGSDDPSKHLEADPLIDLRSAVENIPGGEESISEFAVLMIEETSRSLALIRDGLTGKDSEKVRRGAHTIKGSAKLFVSNAVAEAAWTLEEVARDGDLMRAGEMFGEFEDLLLRLHHALHELIDQSTAG